MGVNGCGDDVCSYDFRPLSAVDVNQEMVCIFERPAPVCPPFLVFLRVVAAIGEDGFAGGGPTTAVIAC